MLKLLNATYLRSSDKANLIQVELADGYTQDVWFPASTIELELDEHGIYRDGSIYAEEWFIESKEEEIGEYILKEKITNA